MQYQLYVVHRPFKMILLQGKQEEKKVENDIKSAPENTNDNKQLLDQYLARVTYKLEMDQKKTHVQVKARWFTARRKLQIN